MWPFKRKPESPQEKAALEKLDEVTREAADAELDKEAVHELGSFSPAATLGVVARPLHGDPDPAGGPSMHDVMHGEHVDDKVHGVHVEEDAETPNP